MSGPPSAVLHGVRILAELRAVADELVPNEAALVAVSCHQIWFELHEDLLATLTLSRG